MYSAHPLLMRFVVFIVLPLIAASVYLVSYLYKSLPVESGSISVQGLNATVLLERDEYGVVNIQAQSDLDAFFTLGYAQAQDRLWQMEVQRRTAQGRLSEIFGKDSVGQDIWFRTLGLYQSAANSWNALSPKARSSLNSYAAGVNAWLSSEPVLPPEFILLDIKPEPWHVHDSLSIVKIFALNLSGNFRTEISRLLASQVLDTDQLATIFDVYLSDAPVTVSDISKESQRGLGELLALQQSIEENLNIGGKFVGSNAWAVSPKFSQDGNSLLANDPHLGLQIPSLWYAVSIKGDRLDVSGMTLAGLPVVIMGRNQSIAWAATAMTTDNQDLYFEQVDPRDPSLYMRDGEWHPFKNRKEKIYVKADFPSSLRKPLKPVEIVVRSTGHGPVISDQFKVFNQPFSLKWTALAESDTSFESFYQLNYASDWLTFKQALSYHVAPNLNMLFTDRLGNIGYLGVGTIPIRKIGNGSLPVPGWNSEYDWSRFVPPTEWPQILNPDKGFIVSANNKSVTDDYPYFISQDWAPPDRAERITQLLNEKILETKSKLTLKNMGEIQADFVNISATKLLPLLTDLEPQTEQQKQALGYLLEWNGEMSRDSQAASLFAVWTRFLKRSLFADELAGEWGKVNEKPFLRSLISNVTLRNVQLALKSSSPNWCDDVSTSPVEDCKVILRNSLEDTLRQLTKLKGNDLSEWQWGEINRTAYKHQPFSHQKLLDVIFERKIGNGGSANTVNVAVSSFDQSEGYLQTFGAGFRQLIGMGQDKTSHMIMNSTGQSGNVLSPHYSDMVEQFRDVEFISIDNVLSSEKTIRLTPVNEN